MKLGRGPWIYLILIIGCTVFAAYDVITQRTQYNADIRAALPAASHSRQANADRYFSAQAMHQGIISVRADSNKTLLSAIHQYLAEHHFVSQQQPDRQLQTLAQFYAPYSPLITSPHFSQALQTSANYSRYFYTRLSETASPFVSASMALDPTLNTAAFLAYMTQQTTLFSLDNDNLIVNGERGPRIFIFFDYQGQENTEIQQFDHLATHLKQWQISYPNADLMYSGAPFHNAENTQLAKQEMALFSTLSLVILVVVMGITFRNLYTFMYIHLSVLAAILAGFGVLLMVFATVHVLALVFGITLIGIAVDYTLHVIAHQDSEKSPYLKTIKTAISLGFVTTVLGYCSFLFTGVSMLIQVAVFVVAGLTAAWGFAMWMVPETATPTFKNSVLFRFSLRYNRVLCQVSPRTLLTISTLLIILALTYLQPHFVQSPAVLNASSAQLKQQEAIHYQYLFANQQRYLVHASSAQQYLEKEAKLITQIQTHYPSARFDAISLWLPPVSQQLKNRQHWQQAVNTGTFSPVSEWVSAPIPALPETLLRPSDFTRPPLSTLYDSHIYEQSDGVTGWFSVTLAPEAAFSASLDLEEGVKYDKVLILSQAMASLIHHVAMIALITLGIICVVIFARHGIGRALLSLIVLVNIVGGALLVSFSIDAMLTLFHLLAVMLILALAADYLIFYLSQGREPNTQFAITLSGITSLSVFGVLVFSQTPAIHQLGLTVLTGVLLTLILTPLVTKEFT
ncbi:MMPL family transporter [Alteromonas sp. C1M14]|uniref:MMPL family transporter n=1 Tax=Alteromonas sp. C1M14 TaxID=2841567 RepID=UPI001C09798B|nr:MMPL family transporter [Alteromonas sp. C1M14]MBU2979665.1 MMPL family transporter [Alteromonas sp. C1M14]